MLMGTLASSREEPLSFSLSEFLGLTWWLTTICNLSLRGLMSSSGLLRHCMDSVCRHTCRETPTYINKISFKNSISVLPLAGPFLPMVHWPPWPWGQREQKQQTGLVQPMSMLEIALWEVISVKQLNFILEYR